MADWQEPKTMSFWIWGVIFIVLFIVAYILLFVRNYMARIMKETQRQADLELETQKGLLRQALYVQEEERSRIALDLHDNLISQLNIIRMLNENGEGRDSINVKLKNTMTSARRISHDLVPPLLHEMTLGGLIEEYLVSLRIGIEINYHCSQSSEEIQVSQVKLHVFRIFQEVISNCLKHANATEIAICFRGTTSQIALRIEDNGNGNLIKSRDGLGLKNIQSRAQFLKANYRYNSTKGEGANFLLHAKLN